MLFVGECNDCCVPPPEPAQYRAQFYSAKARGRAVRNTSSGVSEYGEKNTLFPYESLCHSWEAAGGAACLVSCPEGFRANKFTVPNLTAPADDWAAMQSDVWDDVTPGATDKQNDAENWLLTPLFTYIEPAWKCVGATGYWYDCTLKRQQHQMNVGRLAWTWQYRRPPQPFSFAAAYLLTEAKVSSSIAFLYWPLDPSASMQSQHGIHSFKVYYRTVKPNGVFTNTPFGSYVDKYVNNPTVCTPTTFSRGSSIDVQYGFVGTPSVGYPEDALQQILDGTATTDGSLSPDANNTAQTGTFTAGTGTAASTDPNNIYWIGFCVSSPKYPGSPFTIGHPGLPVPNFWVYGTGKPGRIYTYWAIEQFYMCYIYKVEALDAGAAVVDTYNF